MARKKHGRRPLVPHDSDEGVQSVRCRICRGYLRVISGGRHLSKHGVDRQTYMEEYGLGPDELIAKDFRLLRSSRPELAANGKKEWLRAIKQIPRRGGDLSAKYLQKNQPHLYRQGLWIFGDWDKALRAAGFDPERARLHRAWDEESISESIRRLRERSLTLCASYVVKNHAGLFQKARLRFGSWSAALIAAGIAKNPDWLRGSRLEILGAPRDILENRSVHEVSRVLRCKAEYYFGSLRKAVAAVKKSKKS